jgi:hypothetical protein
MAMTRLSDKALFVERGYGQVEPNHLSAQRTGQIYAQLPAKSDINYLENGQFVKYNYAAGVVDFEGEGEWMLVLNEVKIYDDKEVENDFAMKKADYSAKVYNAAGVDMPGGSTMVPRVFKTNVGDIFTTNTIAAEALELGNILSIGADGYLAANENGDQKWQVVKVYTLADRQKAVKIMRIA